MSESNLAARVYSFATEQGCQPVGVWSAPGRVNLIGEHTDYNEGFVLPFAIEQRTAVALCPRVDRVVSVWSRQSQGPVSVSLDELNRWEPNGWSAYPLGVVWALVDDGVDSADARGCDLFIDSDVPIGAGLSSSAAIECAVALALHDYWTTAHSRAELARICQRAENTAVGAPTGIMDQSVSLLASPGNALFLDCRSLETNRVPLDLTAQHLTILAMDTGVKHANADGGYASRRASCERAAEAMGVVSLRDVSLEDLSTNEGQLDEVTFRRARHILTENERVLQVASLLQHEGALSIGDLLVKSHHSMRDDFEISCPELDLAVEVALDAGAVGARMTGGGFGGTAIALVREDSVQSVTEEVSRAFGQAGFKRPHIFAVRPCAGAHRDNI